MKKHALLLGMIFLLGTFNLEAQDSIPNNSFENWYNSTNPAIWHTVNELLPPGFITCSQTANSYEGSYALSMKTIDMDGMLVPAVATLGIVGMGFTEGGIPFTGRPETIKGYFKHPSAGDAVQLIVQFYKQGVEIGSAYWSTSDSIANFTMLESPVYFTNSENPDTLNITILTDQNILGSNLIIDALQFEYPLVNIFTTEMNSPKIYPNPCQDILKVTSVASAQLVQIFNLTGKLLMEKQIMDKTSTLNLQSLPIGMYIVKVMDGTSSYHQKIMKQ